MSDSSTSSPARWTASGASRVATRLVFWAALSALPVQAQIFAPIDPMLTVELMATNGGNSSPGLPLEFADFSAARDDGWVAVAPIGGLPPFAPGIFGRRDATTAAGFLRGAPVLGGTTFGYLAKPSLAAGEIAYLAAPTSLDARSAWLEDTLLAAPDQLIGSTGLRWGAIEDVRHTTSGRTFVRGTSTIGPFTSSAVVVEYPSATIVLAEGTSPAGVADVLLTIESFEPSESGDRWVSRGLLANGQRQVLIVDGAVHEFGLGELALAGETIPATLLQLDPAAWPTPWQSFGTALINDRGDLVFEANFGLESVVRNGRAQTLISIALFAAIPASPSITGIDAEGFFLTAPTAQILGGTVGLDTWPLADDAGLQIDVDGDGQIDPDWRVTPGEFVNAINKLEGSGGAAYSLVLIEQTGSTVPPRQAVVKVERYVRDEVICAGVPNSTGHAARMQLVGFDRADAHDLAILCTELPPFSFVLPLFAMSTGSTPNVGGSAGTLCLGSDVGRFSGLTGFGGFPGRAYIPLDLSTLPLGTGPVPAAAGQTWYMQTWYRDIQTTSGSNLSDAVAITFR